MKTLWERLWVMAEPAIWAAVGGGGLAANEAIDAALRYGGDFDWTHIQKVAIQGAVAGVVGYALKRRALYKEPPSNSNKETQP